MKDEGITPFQNILVNKSEVVDLALASVETGKGLLITYLNQHCFNIYYSHEAYRNILTNHFVYYLDGYGMWLVLRLVKKSKIKRFNASEINNELFKVFTQKQIPLIIIGGNFNNSHLVKKQLNVQVYLNGYEDVRDLEFVLQKISECSAKIVVIGMGVPLQEKLAYKISHRIPGLQIICVGNFLEFYFGTKKRAPKFLRNSGFEWMFRLILEPRRLWKRYLYGIPLFLYRVIKSY